MKRVDRALVVATVAIVTLGMWFGRASAFDMFWWLRR